MHIHIQYLFRRSILLYCRKWRLPENKKVLVQINQLLGALGMLIVDFRIYSFYLLCFGISIIHKIINN
jgi:hypothetical protein